MDFILLCNCWSQALCKYSIFNISLDFHKWPCKEDTTSSFISLRGEINLRVWNFSRTLNKLMMKLGFHLWPQSQNSKSFAKWPLWVHTSNVRACVSCWTLSIPAPNMQCYTEKVLSEHWMGGRAKAEAYLLSLSHHLRPSHNTFPISLLKTGTSLASHLHPKAFPVSLIQGHICLYPLPYMYSLLPCVINSLFEFLYLPSKAGCKLCKEICVLPYSSGQPAPCLLPERS